MSTRNYEEYRAQVLDSLGEDYTVEDLRNETRWRAKVLESLGVEHDAYDISYFERYRLKVLEGLSNGAGGGFKLLASKEFEVNTTSTTAITVGTIQAGSEAWDSSKLVVVSIRDKAGKRAGYFFGTDNFIANHNEARGSSASVSIVATLIYMVNPEGQTFPGVTNSGVYASAIDSSGTITIKAKYGSSVTRTIDGTFKCDVYIIDFPNGVSPTE